jgi:hypothetical protein
MSNMTEDCKAFIKSINKIKTTKNKKPKKLSGYNVFCQEQRNTVIESIKKATKSDKIEPTQVMTKLGALWKECTKKDTYKKKSEKANAAAAKEAEKEMVEDDEQVLQLKSQIDDLIKQFKKALNKKKKAEAAEAEEAEEEAEEAEEAAEEEEAEEEEEE